jgi:hypothetical protein
MFSSGPSKFDLWNRSVQSILPALLKINNPEVRNSLLKYIQTDPPDESDLRKNYLHRYYEDTLNKTKTIVQERK